MATPTPVIAGGVSAVAVGDGYTCALVNGALRCRGYNGYGAISVTQGLGGIGDARPFEVTKGDVRTLSHAQADATIARERTPPSRASNCPTRLGVSCLVN